MKKRIQIFFSFLLLISFSWQCAAKSVIVFKFRLNQKELAQTVCENKDKPKSCCAAKCYLDKEIKKENKRESDSSSTIKDKTEKSELRTGLMTFLFITPIINQQFVPPFQSSLSFGFIPSVFHPPSC